MTRTRFDQHSCPIARTSDLLGDWWTPLVLRELLFGRTRFNEIQQQLDMNRSLLTRRLQRLELDGIIARSLYSEHPPRSEYLLTDKGRALWDVVSVMWTYGETWLGDGHPTTELVDKRTGRLIEPVVVDKNTGASLDLASTRRNVRD